MRCAALVHSWRRESQCTSASARNVGHRCLTCSGSPIRGPTSMSMVSLLSHRHRHCLGNQHANTTAPSSLWVSTSTASCTTTSLLSVASRPAAFVVGVLAIERACKQGPLLAWKPWSLETHGPGLGAKARRHLAGSRGCDALGQVSMLSSPHQV